MLMKKSHHTAESKFMDMQYTNIKIRQERKTAETHGKMCLFLLLLPIAAPPLVQNAVVPPSNMAPICSTRMAYVYLSIFRIQLFWVYR
jgi:hypothetical protein